MNRPPFVLTIWLLVLNSLVPAGSYAQKRPGLHMVKLDSLFGLVNDSGKIVLPAAYDFISDAHKGHYWLKKKEPVRKTGYVGEYWTGMADSAGKLLFPAEYMEIKLLGNGWYAALTDSGWKISNLSRQFQIPGLYRSVDQFADGRIVVRPVKSWIGKDHAGKRWTLSADYGVIDTTGGQVLPFKHDYISLGKAKEPYILSHADSVYIGSNGQDGDGIVEFAATVFPDEYLVVDQSGRTLFNLTNSLTSAHVNLRQFRANPHSVYFSYGFMHVMPYGLVVDSNGHVLENEASSFHVRNHGKLLYFRRRASNNPRREDKAFVYLPDKAWSDGWRSYEVPQPLTVWGLPYLDEKSPYYIVSGHGVNRGIIDSLGHMMSKDKFSQIYALDKEHFVVRSGEHYGVYHPVRGWVVRPKYDSYHAYYGGSLVMLGKRHNLLFEKGQWSAPIQLPSFLGHAFRLGDTLVGVYEKNGRDRLYNINTGRSVEFPVRSMYKEISRPLLDHNGVLEMTQYNTDSVTLTALYGSGKVAYQATYAIHGTDQWRMRHRINKKGTIWAVSINENWNIIRPGGIQTDTFKWVTELGQGLWALTERKVLSSGGKSAGSGDKWDYSVPGKAAIADSALRLLTPFSYDLIRPDGELIQAIVFVSESEISWKIDDRYVGARMPKIIHYYNMKGERVWGK